MKILINLFAVIFLCKNDLQLCLWVKFGFLSDKCLESWHTQFFRKTNVAFDRSTKWWLGICQTKDKLFSCGPKFISVQPVNRDTAWTLLIKSRIKKPEAAFDSVPICNQLNTWDSVSFYFVASGIPMRILLFHCGFVYFLLSRRIYFFLSIS